MMVSLSSYEEFIVLDRTSLSITWLKDKSLTDLDNLPNRDELVEEIADKLECAPSFREV
jgi:type I restriction enzyme M protein